MGTRSCSCPSSTDDRTARPERSSAASSLRMERAVAVAAVFSMNWNSARAAMWMALIAVWLIHRFPGEMATSAGWMMAEQVLLGAIIGGLLGAAFEFAGLSRSIRALDRHGARPKG